MAKLAVILTVFLVGLLASSQAQNPLDFPETEFTDREFRDDWPESDVKTTAKTILLPSEKPAEFDSFRVGEWESKTTEFGHGNTEAPEEIQESENTDSSQFTVLTFRPVHHQFPRHQYPLPFSHNHRPLHHRHGHHLKSHSSHDVANNEDMKFGTFGPVFRGDVHQIPSRLVRLHHRGSRFPSRWGAGTKKPHHHNIHHQNHRRQDREEEVKEHKHGLMKKIRKFLHQF